MLTNKKTAIRVLALVLALLMTAAMFVGCKNNATVDDVEAANAAAKAAQSAADAAKKAADEAAAKAADLEKQLKDSAGDNEELAAQLKAAQEAAAEAQKRAEEAQKAADEAKKSADDPDNMQESKFDDATDKISANSLEKFTALKNKYLIDQKTWYTTENYAKLSALFEKASLEIYRATTAEGVDAVINEVSAAAAAIDNVVSEAAAIAAKIDAFGDVYANVYVSTKAQVAGAREAFDAWVEKYATCFFVANGYAFKYVNKKGELVDTNASVDHILTNTADEANVGANKQSNVEASIIKAAQQYTKDGSRNIVFVGDYASTLVYAETKIGLLETRGTEAAAKMLAVAVNYFQSEIDPSLLPAVNYIFFGQGTAPSNEAQVKALAEFLRVQKLAETKGVTYDGCKANAVAIEEAYREYRIVWNANGDDASSIVFNYTDEDKKTTQVLTGDQFVKLFVLAYYNGELKTYESAVQSLLAKDIVAKVIADGSAYLFDGKQTYAADGSKEVSSLASSAKIVLTDGFIKVGDVNYLKANAALIKNRLEDMATVANTQILNLGYAEDFKGKKSLEDAFLAIDQIAAEAVYQMKVYFYNEVVKPVIAQKINDLEAAYKAVYGKTADQFKTQYAGYTVANYQNVDTAFMSAISAKIADLRTAVDDMAIEALADLKAEYKPDATKDAVAVAIADQRLFKTAKHNNNTDDYIVSVALADGAAPVAYDTIANALTATVKEACFAIAEVKAAIDEEVKFVEFKKDFAMAIDDLLGEVVKADAKTAETKYKAGTLELAYLGVVMTVNGIKVNDANRLSTADALFKKLDAVRDVAVANILALQYNDFAAKSYQMTATAKTDNFAKAAALVVTNNGTGVIYDAKTAGDKKVANAALTAMVDRIVVAENEVIATYNVGANTILKVLTDEVRTGAADKVGDYSTYQRYIETEADPGKAVALKADFEAYRAELLKQVAAESYAIKVADYSLADHTTKQTLVTGLTAEGYNVQTIKSGKVYTYIVHIDALNSDFKADNMRVDDAQIGVNAAQELVNNAKTAFDNAVLAVTNALSTFNATKANKATAYDNAKIAAAKAFADAHVAVSVKLVDLKRILDEKTAAYNAAKATRTSEAGVLGLATDAASTATNATLYAILANATKELALATSTEAVMQAAYNLASATVAATTAKKAAAETAYAAANASFTDAESALEVAKGLLGTASDSVDTTAYGRYNIAKANYDTASQTYLNAVATLGVASDTDTTAWGLYNKALADVAAAQAALASATEGYTGGIGKVDDPATGTTLYAVYNDLLAKLAIAVDNLNAAQAAYAAALDAGTAAALASATAVKEAANLAVLGMKAKLDYAILVQSECAVAQTKVPQALTALETAKRAVELALADLNGKAVILGEKQDELDAAIADVAAKTQAKSDANPSAKVMNTWIAKLGTVTDAKTATYTAEADIPGVVAKNVTTLTDYAVLNGATADLAAAKAVVASKTSAFNAAKAAVEAKKAVVESATTAEAAAKTAMDAANADYKKYVDSKINQWMIAYDSLTVALNEFNKLDADATGAYTALVNAEATAKTNYNTAAQTKIDADAAYSKALGDEKALKDAYIKAGYEYDYATKTNTHDKAARYAAYLEAEADLNAFQLATLTTAKSAAESARVNLASKTAELTAAQTALASASKTPAAAAFNALKAAQEAEADARAACTSSDVEEDKKAVAALKDENDAKAVLATYENKTAADYSKVTAAEADKVAKEAAYESAKADLATAQAELTAAKAAYARALIFAGSKTDPIADWEAGATKVMNDLVALHTFNADQAYGEVLLIFKAKEAAKKELAKLYKSYVGAWDKDGVWIGKAGFEYNKTELGFFYLTYEAECEKIYNKLLAAIDDINILTKESIAVNFNGEKMVGVAINQSFAGAQAALNAILTAADRNIAYGDNAKNTEADYSFAAQYYMFCVK